MESNIRFGVVNEANRDKYEKEYQISYGYLFTTYNENKAILHAKKMNNPNVIVEKIFDDHVSVNNKKEIYRSGKFKGRRDEKNN